MSGPSVNNEHLVSVSPLPLVVLPKLLIVSLFKTKISDHARASEIT